MPYNDSFRSLWAAAGYRTDMGSAATGYPPSSSEVVRLYYLTSAQHAFSNISLKRLKIARLSDLNDPFELMALNFKFGQVRRLVREFKNTFGDSNGLLCFSEDWTSPVMWSHYAEKHRGICLGFNIFKNSVQKIQYEDKRLLAELGESGDPFGLTQELQNLLLYTKCHEWGYEQERRMFVSLADAIHDGGFHFKRFGVELQLAEVILGPNCLTSLDDVRRITDNYSAPVNTFKARLAWKHFKVVPQESSVS